MVGFWGFGWTLSSSEVVLLLCGGGAGAIIVTEGIGMRRQRSIRDRLTDVILPERLERLIDDELEQDEVKVWVGQPIPGRAARRTWGAVAFGIPWTAFALFWTAGAAGFTWPPASGGGGWSGFSLFPLFGLPFILVGCVMLSSPYWARRNARRTAYVLTDRRAIVFAGGRSTAVKSFRADQLREVSRTQRADGSGDVVFTKKVRVDSDGDKQATDVGFLDVRDVKYVETLVKDLVLMSGDAGGQAGV